MAPYIKAFSPIQNYVYDGQGRWQGVTPVTKLRGPQALRGPQRVSKGPQGLSERLQKILECDLKA